MADPAFFFFHIGPELQPPTLLVESIRRVHPQSAIVQMTDMQTPEIPGVSEVRRAEGNPDHIMVSRVQSFAARGEAGIYLDTDILVTRPLNHLLEGDYDVGLTERDQQPNMPISPQVGPMYFPEFNGKTTYQQFPYLASLTLLPRPCAFFADCLQVLNGLKEEYKRWYGDQEAMRIVVEQGGYRFRKFPQSRVNYVPGVTEQPDRERISALDTVHFKGQLKTRMPKYNQALAEWAKAG